MRTTQQLSVTLPNEMAAQVKARVASGEYASESEVIREGLRALQDRERALEKWLRTEVVAAYDEMKADPSRGRSLEQVRATLAASHWRRTAFGPAIEASKALSNWIGDRVDNLELRGSDRVRLASACLHIALTHHSSIVALIDGGRYASGFALIRPQIDSYLRGLWLHYIASDEKLAGIPRGDDPPGTRDIMAQLERMGHFDPSTLTQIGVSMWPIVCDYTHTGGRAMTRHLTGNSVEPHFEVEEIIEALQASNAWALMAAIGLAGFANDGVLAAHFLEKCKVHFRTQ